MAELDKTGSTPPEKGTSRTSGKRSGKPKRRQPSRARVTIDRRTPLHQSRILAMQALYEDDLTEHQMDDILQHIGVSRRRDLEAYFSETERLSLKVVDTIAFLSRNAGRDATGATLEEFVEAANRAITRSEIDEDTTDAENVDPYIEVVQERVNLLVNSIHETFRDKAYTYLTSLPPAPEIGIEDDEVADETLSRLEQDARRQLRDTFLREERASLVTLLEMLKRAERLSRGVRTHIETIDPYIEKAAPAFPLPQLASIDRTVLRLAIYEVLHESDVPYKVAINEAVDIAKEFGGPNSGRFVNGVLRTISEQLPKRT